MIVHLPYPPRSLSPNARVHWGQKSRATKEYRFACMVAGLEARKQAPPCTTHRTLTLVFQKTKGVLPDEDNCLAHVKAGIDGLRDAKVLADDSPQFMRVASITVRRGSPSEVLVEITDE